MLSSSSSRLDSLPTRPPTPPRDVSNAVDEAISFLDDSNEIDRALKQSRTAVPSNGASPPQSSPSSQRPPASSNGSKKVGFTPCPTYHQIARAGQLSSPGAQVYKRVPTPKDAKPIKSILKQSNLPPPLTPDDIETKLNYFSPQEPGSFAKMIQSIIQQLAGPSVTARLDAYLALNGAHKAYDSIPDTQAMVSKMSLLMQFLTRDMVWKNANGALDTNIITQAVKLTVTLLFDVKLSAALDDDFRTFCVDRSITVIEHAEMPKALVKVHMYLLAQQRFRAPAINSTRAERIISALTTIEDRCTGNNVVATRLVIYQRMMEQASRVMLQRMRDWFEHLVHGMLSDTKDVRIRAIETCTQAGRAFGEQPLASKAVLDLLQSEVEEDQTFCDHVILRLTQMVSEKDMGTYVPQIWSAIVLFFRNKRHSLDKWPKFKAWLQVIQRCMNSSNLTIRYQAHLAWDRLVFTVMPDASTSSGMLGMLKIPVVSGMDISKNDPNAKQIGEFALDSYYNILHYALRPGLSHEELDSAWDAVVEPVLLKMAQRNNKGQYIACAVIHGLCSANPGLWNRDAASEPAPIRPEELPRLDVKWVRSRLARFLKLVEPILSATMWAVADATSAVDAAWYALMQTLADAGTQEIKTSTDLKEAIALLANLWRRIWTECGRRPSEAAPDTFIRRYTSLISTAIQCIGAGPFAEDILAKDRDDSIQAALTPSHRSSKHHGAPQSPFSYLFGLLYQPSEAVQEPSHLARLASRILQLHISTRASTTAQVELLAKQLQTSSAASLLEVHAGVIAHLWRAVAVCATGIIKKPLARKDRNESQSLGQELRNASNILAQGLRHAPACDETSDAVTNLYDVMLGRARKEAGIGGMVVAVTEPFAKALLESTAYLPDGTRLRLADSVVSTTVWPRSRQEMDQAKKALWGVGLAPHKSAAFDPFDHVYQLICGVLLQLYSDVEGLDEEGMTRALTFFKSILSFLESAPLSLLAVALRKTQVGFVAWLADASRKTSAIDAATDAVRSLWRELLQLVESLPQKDSTLLQALEPLLVAALSSPHKVVVNDSITSWNATFGQGESIEYPPQLEKVLRLRAAETDINLPSLVDPHPEDTDYALPAFYESQLPLARPRTAQSDFPSDFSRVPATAPIQRSSYLPSAVAARPTSSPAPAHPRSSARSTPKARLRHDDSRIQFAAIESSPLPPAEESQLLTEHQKEVKNRQYEVAQMFPDLSSSPAIRQGGQRGAVQKRLNFTSEDREEQDGTPMRSADEAGPMSDDIPSSPTPSSNKDAESAQIEMAEETMTEDEEPLDPPSSPPRQAEDVTRQAEKDLENEDGPMAASLDGPQNFEDKDEDALPGENGPEGRAPVVRSAASNEVTDHRQHHDSDLPSDTLLPDAQLQLEAQQAAGAEDGEAAGDTTIGTTFYQAGTAKPAETQDAVKSVQNLESSAVDPSQEVDMSRIQDSFIVPTSQQDGEQDVEDSGNSQPVQRGNRKRKRSSEVVHTAKKRKQQSPLKRITGFFSTFMKGTQEDDDDDMDDEIVVASSQVATSPETARQMENAPSPVVEVPVLAPESFVLSQPEQTTTAQQPQKRGRGRPRKSETPTPASSQLQTSQSRSLKRKASVLSETSTDELATSFVKDTPAPPKARKQREGSDLKLIKAARLSQDEADVGRSTRRSVASSAGDTVEEQDVGDGDSEDEEAVKHESPTRQLAEGAVASAHERPIASPKRIIGRLRDALADLRKSILGPQEEREVDDVLFEIRKEVYEAGRRGRV